MVVTLEPSQNSAGQYAELYHCIMGPLHQREEVSEYCHRPGVRGVDLVLGTEGRRPDLIQPLSVHLLQEHPDGQVVGSEQLLNADVLVGTSLGYSFNRPLLWQKVVFPTDIPPLLDMGNGTLPQPQLHPYCTDTLSTTRSVASRALLLLAYTFRSSP